MNDDVKPLHVRLDPVVLEAQRRYMKRRQGKKGGGKKMKRQQPKYQIILEYDGREVIIGGSNEENLREAGEAFLLFKKWVGGIRKREQSKGGGK